MRNYFKNKDARCTVGAGRLISHHVAQMVNKGEIQGAFLPREESCTPLHPEPLHYLPHLYDQSRKR